MARITYARTVINEGTSPAGSLFVCDTVDDLPVTGLHIGDKSIIVSTGAKKYCYNGTSWTDEGGGGPHTHPESDVVGLVTDLAAKMATSAFSGLAKITVGTGQPSNPSEGDLWIDTN